MSRLAWIAVLGVGYVACQSVSSTPNTVVGVPDSGAIGGGGPGVDAAGGGNPFPFPMGGGTGGGAGGGQAPPDPSDAAAGGAPTDPDTAAGGGAPPTCDDFAITAAFLAPARPFLRSDTVEITVGAAAGEIASVEGEGVDGGNVTVRDGAVFFTAGGGIDNPAGVPGPRWTGTVGVRITARDATGCVAEARADVPLDGDVIAGEHTGSLYALGNDGRIFGQYAQLDDRPITDFITLPNDGGPRRFAAAIESRGDRPVTLMLVDADGRPGEPFETVDQGGAPIYIEDQHPRRIVYDAARGEILADGDERARVHRWTLDGIYRGHIEIPSGGSGRGMPIGFGVLEGEVVVGFDPDSNLYRLPADGEPVFFVGAGRSFEDLFSVATGHGDTVLAIIEQVETIYAFGPGGRSAGVGDYGSGYARHMTPFRDGHLYTSTTGGHLRRLGPDLMVADDAWDLRPRDDFPRYLGIAWLD